MVLGTYVVCTYVCVAIVYYTYYHAVCSSIVQYVQMYRCFKESHYQRQLHRAHLVLTLVNTILHHMYICVHTNSIVQCTPNGPGEPLEQSVQTREGHPRLQPVSSRTALHWAHECVYTHKSRLSRSRPRTVTDICMEALLAIASMCGHAHSPTSLGILHRTPVRVRVVCVCMCVCTCCVCVCVVYVCVCLQSACLTCVGTVAGAMSGCEGTLSPGTHCKEQRSSRHN